MAYMQEEVIVVKVSKLVKDGATTPSALTEEVLASIEAVVQELAGAGALVEIQVA